MNRARWMLIGLMVIGSGIVMPAEAQEHLLNPSEGAGWISEGVYHDALDPTFVKPLVKLGRGLGNAVGGPLEIPLTIQRLAATTDPMTGLFTGLILGAFKAVIRSGIGVYEAVTFLIPCPEHYAPILPPLAFPEAGS